MAAYTVVGIYVDNNQRFAHSVEAEGPAEAEATAVEELADGQDDVAVEDLLVAAVFAGRLSPVDVDPALGGG
jgi:hypothetical protein